MLAITGEDKGKVMRFLSTKNCDMPQYGMGFGGSIQRSSGGIPHCYIISADGQVVYDGHPGSISKKDLQAELRKVERGTDAVLEAKASAVLTYAQEKYDAQRYLHAQDLFKQVTKEYKGTDAASTAEEKLAEMKKNKELKAELKAQTALLKVIGGHDTPKEKIKGKDRDRMSVMLEALVKKYEDTPGAKAIAEEWAGWVSE